MRVLLPLLLPKPLLGRDNLGQKENRWAHVTPDDVAANDNDNDTLREVPHPSNEGLALQARV